jgi:hypothetical protein
MGTVTLPNTEEGKRHAKQSSARFLRKSVIAWASDLQGCCNVNQSFRSEMHFGAPGTPRIVLVAALLNRLRP